MPQLECDQLLLSIISWAISPVSLDTRITNLAKVKELRCAWISALRNCNIQELALGLGIIVSLSPHNSPCSDQGKVQGRIQELDDLVKLDQTIRWYPYWGYCEEEVVRVLSLLARELLSSLSDETADFARRCLQKTEAYAANIQHEVFYRYIMLRLNGQSHVLSCENTVVWSLKELDTELQEAPLLRRARMYSHLHFRQILELGSSPP